MKPEQFIRDFGEKKAREVVEGAPEGSSYLQAIGSGKLIHYLGVKDEDVQLFFIDHWRPTCFDPSDLDDDVFISLEHLKRLVESLDMIIRYAYDLEGAKQLLELADGCGKIEFKSKTITVKRFEEAVRDYESIYGEGDE
ncbi:hypothetical protein VXR13_18560 [Acinetobacter baumannii]|uniref:hypothetical protein n=1 Tax=Acinetobacter baumannii TaxID=470 RepID=UPI003A8B275A